MRATAAPAATPTMKTAQTLRALFLMTLLSLPYSGYTRYEIAAQAPEVTGERKFLQAFLSESPRHQIRGRPQRSSGFSMGRIRTAPSGAALGSDSVRRFRNLRERPRPNSTLGFST